MEGGDDLPIQVHQVNEDNRGAQPGQKAHVMADAHRKQERKGEDELEDSYEDADLQPPTLGSFHVPGHFMGDIPGPDDQKLEVCQVSPASHKGQHKSSQVLEGNGRVPKVPVATQTQIRHQIKDQD